jgi:hypothetical protein
MTFFYDMNKKLAKLAQGKEQLTEGAVLDKLRHKVGEAAKPDFLDLDQDGNRHEPMKQAARQAKQGVEEGKPKPFSSDDYDKFGVRKSSSFNQPPKAKTKVSGRDLAPDLTRAVEKASGGQETLRRDAKGVLQVVKKTTKKKPATHKVEELKLADLPVKSVQGKRYGGASQTDEPDADDQDDGEPRHMGRKAVGAGRGKKIGAKVKGTSKLHRKGAIAEELPPGAQPDDAGEYGNEGDQAKDQIHTIVRHAQALEKILADREDLPEWVQMKLTKIEGMMSTVDDYMQTQHERDGEMATGEEGQEQPLGEKAVSVAQRRAAGIAHAAQKGEIPKSELRGASREMAKMSKKELHKFAATKEKGLPTKKKEVEETSTVAGSVATAPAPRAKSESADVPKKSPGGKMQYGKGIYDSMNRELEAMISESMSVNISRSSEGNDSVTVTATEEDAGDLIELLKRAGVGVMPHTPDSHACPSCGQEPCACATQVDENQPEWPTNTETNSDALQYSGGVNKPKTDVAGDGQTVMPTTAVRVQETEDLDENKCMECGMYESKCECDRPMDESLERIRELAGVQEAAKPDFLDIDQDGDREEPMTQAAAEKDQKLDEVLPAIGAALARTAVGSGASALTRGAASLAGQMAGKALQDKLSSNKENQAFESSLQDMTRLWKAYKA